jgi:hypothetical protein
LRSAEAGAANAAKGVKVVSAAGNRWAGAVPAEDDADG